MIELLSNLEPAYIVIGAIFTLVIFYRPFVGFFCMALMIPLEPIVTFSAGFTAIKAVGIMTFMAFILHFCLGKEKIIIEWKVFFPLILFVVWTALTIGGRYGRILVLGQLLVFAMIAIFLCYNNDRRLILVICALTVGCFIAICFAASGYLSGNAISTRAALQEQNANKFALTIGIGIIMLLFFRSAREKLITKTRWKIFISLILNGGIVLFWYGLIISASRGAVVALGATFLLYLAGNKNKLKSVATIIMIFILVSTVLVVGLRMGFITDYSVNRIKTLESLEDTTLSGRLAIWRIGLKIAKNNLFMGVGLGNFASAFGKYSGVSFSNVVIMGTQWDPHNTYLSILVETGLVGFVLFMWFLGSLFFYILKKKNEIKLFSLCLFAFIGIISLKGTIHTTKVYWICLALCYLISNYGSQYFYSKGNSEAEEKENKSLNLRLPTSMGS